MGKTWKYETLNIIRDAIISSFHKGQGLRCPEQGQAATRTDPKLERFGTACEVHDLKKIIHQRIIKTDTSDHVLKCNNVRPGHYRLKGLDRVARFTVA